MQRLYQRPRSLRLNQRTNNYMLQAKVYSAEGVEVKAIDLDEAVWGKVASSALLHQAVVAFLANRRVDVTHGKKRGEVRGGGRKPWKQKGTGRARAGSIRSPLWRGGGTMFGPTQERVYTQQLPKAMRRRALLGAMNAKAIAGDVLVIQSLPADGKTKSLAAMLAKLPIEQRPILLILPGADAKAVLVARNIPKLTLTAAASLNAYEVLRNRYLLVAESALPVLSATFS
jgi:large subunit ribosomal protein L4